MGHLDELVEAELERLSIGFGALARIALSRYFEQTKGQREPSSS